MKILFLCTAHNSLSQRLSLALSTSHALSIEYALSDQAMIEAADLAKPELVICPFLTTKVPSEVYHNYLTLIIHPGPPGDAGPSALDWLLMGDDGTQLDASQLLKGDNLSGSGRSHWGVTVLQAIETFDAGPVWAFDQFPVDIDSKEVTKSSLYRGPVTRAALAAITVAIQRVQQEADRVASLSAPLTITTEEKPQASTQWISPSLRADQSFRDFDVTSKQAFLGGATHNRPLLKAAQREFDASTSTARDISRRIRSADSQPGCLSKIFGPSLYIYGGLVDEREQLSNAGVRSGQIVAWQEGAVCIATCDGKGVWITHVRRLKKKEDTFLWPKVTAVSGLIELNLLKTSDAMPISLTEGRQDWTRAPSGAFQEIYVDFQTYEDDKKVAYLYFDFYNGAMSTDQCSHLIEALEYILASHSQQPLAALAMMGGSGYFSNGIALNVIEAARDPAQESWLNINRIDDVVQSLLQAFPERNIATIAGIRGNCAAGGVALAVACDTVIVGSEVVLNPAYRAVGLYGSEYHSLSYPGRCGEEGAKRLLRAMVPMSPYEACSMGLVDQVLPGYGSTLETRIRNRIKELVCSEKPAGLAPWKANIDLSPSGLAAARSRELGEMSRDFWSARSLRYHERRRDFVRKVKAAKTPLRFATHRRAGGLLDEEERDEFDSVHVFAKRAMEAQVLEISAKLARQFEIQKTVPAIRTMEVLPETPEEVPSPVITEKRDTSPVFSCYFNDSTV